LTESTVESTRKERFHFLVELVKQGVTGQELLLLQGARDSAVVILHLAAGAKFAASVGQNNWIGANLQSMEDVLDVGIQRRMTCKPLGVPPHELVESLSDKYFLKFN
jgi:hypothetical protein